MVAQAEGTQTYRRACCVSGELASLRGRRGQCPVENELDKSEVGSDSTKPRKPQKPANHAVYRRYEGRSNSRGRKGRTCKALRKAIGFTKFSTRYGGQKNVEWHTFRLARDQPFLSRVTCLTTLHDHPSHPATFRLLTVYKHCYCRLQGVPANATPVALLPSLTTVFLYTTITAATPTSRPQLL